MLLLLLSYNTIQLLPSVSLFYFKKFFWGGGDGPSFINKKQNLFFFRNVLKLVYEYVLYEYSVVQLKRTGRIEEKGKGTRTRTVLVQYVYGWILRTSTLLIVLDPRNGNGNRRSDKRIGKAQGRVRYGV